MSLNEALIGGLWVILYSYWGIAGLKRKRTARTEAHVSRLIHLMPIISGFILTLTNWLRIGPLAVRFLPDSQLVFIIGILIEASGIGFAIWARYHLGQYWSGTITIKQEHKLIRTGPYRFVRHPIYTGITVGMIGTAIAVGEWRGVLAVALVIIAYLRKISLEERFLNEQFGSEYAQYRHEVRGLIPFIL
jgi:protein-S-isoprenylcysteine O-methyltransferase Ste14